VDRPSTVVPKRGLTTDFLMQDVIVSVKSSNANGRARMIQWLYSKETCAGMACLPAKLDCPQRYDCNRNNIAPCSKSK
jgi:hypothetical protein